MHPPAPDQSPAHEQPGDSRLEIAPGVLIDPGELRFTALRASGPGGQNVNKVSTKVELRLWISALGLSGPASARLRAALGRRVSQSGEIVLASGEHRSQQQNRKEVLERLRAAVVEALVEPTPRVKTRPTKSSKARRETAKRNQSQIKSGRRRPPMDHD